jgi:DNA-binding transcriptional MerR regulator
MTISEFAARTGVSAHTLRYYERAGLIPMVPRDPVSGRRTYTAEYAEWVRFVRSLRATGMPIRELRRYATLVAEGDTTWPARKAMLAAHRERVVATLALLEEQRLMLDQKLALGCAPAGLWQGAAPVHRGFTRRSRIGEGSRR